jgi:serine/threonine-protein kinase
LLHRDIKPANILVTKDDVVKLSDFGIARAVSEHTMTLTKPGLVMGSVYYISPEQAQGHELHETSDLYSMGVVLYQMLTGKLPYSGESPVTVALKHIGDPVPRIDTRALGVSPALAAIANRLLQKKPENRFQSASDLATALREARERPSVAGYRISDDAPAAGLRAERDLPPRRSPLPDRTYTSIDADEERQARRGPWLIVAMIAVMVIATGIGYFVFGRPLPNLGATIAVADYTGMTDAQAQQEVVNAGLRVHFIKSPSDTVPVNHVIRQNPPPATKLDKDALVELVVSNGKPMVGLLDVRGYSAADAQRTLQAQGFAVSIDQKFDTSPKDNVIDQMPKPNAQVREGSRITLIVSKGQEPIAVPRLVGMTVDKAQATAQRLGLTLDASQQSAVAGVPADTIASQDPAPGGTISKGATVRAVVSTGVDIEPAQPPAGAGLPVPNVVGLAYQNAIDAVTANFAARIVYQVGVGKNGYIVAESPPPGTQLDHGATVILTLSVLGEVPDTEGMTPENAVAALKAAGYGVGQTQYTTTTGAGGKVVGTEPTVGTTLNPGSQVTLIVNGTPP